MTARSSTATPSSNSLAPPEEARPVIRAGFFFPVSTTLPSTPPLLSSSLRAARTPSTALASLRLPLPNLLDPRSRSSSTDGPAGVSLFPEETPSRRLCHTQSRLGVRRVLSSPALHEKGWLPARSSMQHSRSACDLLLDQQHSCMFAILGTRSTAFLSRKCCYINSISACFDENLCPVPGFRCQIALRALSSTHSTAFLSKKCCAINSILHADLLLDQQHS